MFVFSFWRKCIAIANLAVLSELQMRDGEGLQME